MDKTLQTTVMAPVSLQLPSRSLSEAMEFARMVAESQFAPKEFRGKPGDVLVAMQMGAELGLAPMQALQNIAVINGRPSVYGDTLLAIVRARPDCVDVAEHMDGSGDKLRAVCSVQRRGCSPVVRSFSVSDAKRAQLWGKAGPWAQYPERMLQMRARSFACRDAFPDALRGLRSAEECADIPVENAPLRSVTVEHESPNDGNVALELIAAADTISDLESVAQQLKNLDLNSSRAIVIAAYRSRLADLKASSQPAPRIIAAGYDSAPAEPKHDPQTGEVADDYNYGPPPMTDDELRGNE